MFNDEKPMGIKSYGSIPHLIGSRPTPGDKGVHRGAHNICTLKTRDKHDIVIVMEKLDGSNVAVYRHHETGDLIALTRSGWPATTSRFAQHHMFAEYVRFNSVVLKNVIEPGERIVGEWLAQAHGTRYEIEWDSTPFFVFDIMREHRRLTMSAMLDRIDGTDLDTPCILHVGDALSIEEGLERLGPHGRHKAIDMAEGLVYRVERNGEVDFLAKYVDPNKEDGCYLPEISGGNVVWNWRPPTWGEPPNNEV